MPFGLAGCPTVNSRLTADEPRPTVIAIACCAAVLMVSYFAFPVVYTMPLTFASKHGLIEDDAFFRSLYTVLGPAAWVSRQYLPYNNDLSHGWNDIGVWLAHYER